MSGKFKKFSDLGTRQKRRRLLTVRENTHHIEENVDNSTSDESAADIDGRLEEEAMAPVSGEVVQYLLEEQSSDSTDGSENSNQEVIDEFFEDDNISVNAGNETSGGSASEDEEADINVEENPVELQRKALKNAFLAANIKHNQGNILLKTLRQFPFNLMFLPKDSRTILNTPTIVASNRVRQIAGGEYLHIGFKKTLVTKLESLPQNALPENIIIDLSTDGAKVDKGLHQFWPHQYRICNIFDKRPIIVGIFQGKHKPFNVFEFYEQFVQEITEVLEEGGIEIRTRKLPLTLRCFIADAPARAFVLNHYSHNSSNACSKCKIEGFRCTVPGFQGTMVFQGTGNERRTDESYRNLVDEDHHKGRSPLSPLLGLVTRVPFEIMHSVWLGVCKKIIEAHGEGKFGFQRLNARKLQILDSRMLMLESYCPSEFNRRPKEFSLYKHFKATEFRQFLLYTAPAVVKNVFHEDHYRHLMIFHSVMRILISEETPRDMYPFCQEALETFVILCEQLYGQQFLSYNVHSLLHIVADVEVLGPAETFSAFCFENNMPELRKCIRKPGLKLPQVYKRIAEKDDFILTPENDNIRIRLSQKHAEGPLLEDTPTHLCQQFKKLEIGKFTFSTALRNSCCILQNLRICRIQNIVLIEGQVKLIVQEFGSSTAIYDVGITSDCVQVYHCKSLARELQSLPLNILKNKVYMMPKWRDTEGEEELVVQDEWICVSLLSPLQLPENAEIFH